MRENILRRPSVEEITGLSRSSLYEKLNPNSRYHDPDFPKPVKLGQRAVGWRASEIFAWLESRDPAS